MTPSMTLDQHAQDVYNVVETTRATASSTVCSTTSDAALPVIARAAVRRTGAAFTLA